MAGLPDFRSHSKTGPFEIQTNPHCTLISVQRVLFILVLTTINLYRDYFAGRQVSRGDLQGILDRQERVRLGVLADPSQPTSRVHHEHDCQSYRQNGMLVITLGAFINDVTLL